MGGCGSYGLPSLQLPSSGRSLRAGSRSKAPGLGVEGGLDVEHQLWHCHVWPGHLPRGDTSSAPRMELM